MALQVASLSALIVSNMESAGFDAGNEHAWINQFATALATAIIAEIQANAVVNVPSGSSSGSYGVE